jgi:hypothetical protein
MMASINDHIPTNYVEATYFAGHENRKSGCL